MQHINKIKKFYQTHQRMPSYSEMMQLLGYKSKNSVFKLVKKLTQENYLQKDSSGRLIPGNLFHSVRMLGSVRAGFPSPAEEELIDTMTLDEFLIKNQEATYMLTVEGDSMQDAGILPGDIVLVERTNKYSSGDIVVAEVDGEWTMKYLKYRGHQPVLVPANKKYKTIIPEDELKIAAVVKAVVRKY